MTSYERRRLAPAREKLKTWVETHWPVEKIMAVLAFCEEGKMNARDPCCCLVGVHGSAVPHVHCRFAHYGSIKRETPGLEDAELAFYVLAGNEDQAELNRRFAEILREVLQPLERPFLEHCVDFARRIFRRLFG